VRVRVRVRVATMAEKEVAGGRAELAGDGHTVAVDREGEDVVLPRAELGAAGGVEVPGAGEGTGGGLADGPSGQESDEGSEL
jgi:hypothetical protein